MTTIIIIFISVAVLAVLGSKIFSNSSSKGNRSTASDSGKSAPSSNISDQAEASVEKAIKTSSVMNLKNVNLLQAPPENPMFTGRKELLKKILTQTATPPVLIGISGFSGVGKTSLAIPLIKIYSARYPGACLFVDMQGDLPDPPSPQDIMRKVILKFHPTQPLPANEKQLAKLYRVALKKHKGILILDNAAGTKQIKPLVPPPSWLFIVTSTKPVTLTRLVSIKLEPMEVLEAQTLLTRWSPDISPALKEINTVCRGVPLALDTIGKLFAINSTMKPDYFAKKFSESRRDLGEGKKKTSLLDGVRAALSFSYQMLPEKTAAVLRKLAVFPGSFTADAAAFICEDPQKLSIIGLEKFGLIQLNANTGRFSMHHQVKQFIKPKLKPSDRGLVQKRHATEYMNVLDTAYNLVEKGGKDAIKGFRIFDLEMENIQAGLEWSRQHCAQDKDAASVCNAYTESGASLISQRLSPPECILWFEAALIAASQLGDKEAEGKHLLNLGQQYFLMNQSNKAIETLQSALAFCKREGNVEGQGTALQQLGQICMINDEHQQHIKFIEEHLELIKSSGSKIEEFQLLVQLTKSCVKNKEFNKSVHIGEQALELAPINQDKTLLLSLLHSLGKGFMETGETDKALEKFEVAVEISQQISSTPLLGELFQLTGEIVFKSGDIPGALKNLKRGLEAVQKTKDLKASGSLMVQLAEIHMQSQGEDQANNYFEEALSISQQTKDISLKGKTLWQWSLALGKKGSIEEAISRAQKALRIYKDIDPSKANKINAQIEEWVGT